VPQRRRERRSRHGLAHRLLRWAHDLAFQVRVGTRHELAATFQAVEVVPRAAMELPSALRGVDLARAVCRLTSLRSRSNLVHCGATHWTIGHRFASPPVGASVATPQASASTGTGRPKMTRPGKSMRAWAIRARCSKLVPSLMAHAETRRNHR